MTQRGDAPSGLTRLSSSGAPRRALLAGTVVGYLSVIAAYVSPDLIFAPALSKVRVEHEEFVTSHNVWGVPTFIADDQAVFVRLMNRAPSGAAPEPSLKAIAKVLDLLTGWTALNEFKHTTIPR
ncbi:hypothetical protein [Saccharopolyspora sp. NPDC002376]